jgi:hypothetical protein
VHIVPYLDLALILFDCARCYRRCHYILSMAGAADCTVANRRLLCIGAPEREPHRFGTAKLGCQNRINKMARHSLLSLRTSCSYESSNEHLTRLHWHHVSRTKIRQASLSFGMTKPKCAVSRILVPAVCGWIRVCGAEYGRR